MLKRMLEIKGPDPYESDFKKRVYINASSLDVLQTCKRKSFYMFHRNLRGTDDSSPAQTFGSAIHGALKDFYTTNPGHRSLSQFIASFDHYGASLEQSDSGEKRSLENGRKIIEAYFRTYENDPWVIYTDWVEKSFELPYAEYIDRSGVAYRVFVHGTIDAIMMNTETGEIAVVDHKTASTLGAGFVNSIKPRHQFNLYTYAAQTLGIKTNTFMMNGIQVAKTKQEFTRVFSYLEPEDLAETKQAIMSEIGLWIETPRLEALFPMTTSACHQWSGCQYLEICSSKAGLRENVIQSKYGENNG